MEIPIGATSWTGLRFRGLSAQRLSRLKQEAEALAAEEFIENLRQKLKHAQTQRKLADKLEMEKATAEKELQTAAAVEKAYPQYAQRLAQKPRTAGERKKQPIYQALLAPPEEAPAEEPPPMATAGGAGEEMPQAEAPAAGLPPVEPWTPEEYVKETEQRDSIATAVEDLNRQEWELNKQIDELEGEEEARKPELLRQLNAIGDQKRGLMKALRFYEQEFAQQAKTLPEAEARYAGRQRQLIEEEILRQTPIAEAEKKIYDARKARAEAIEKELPYEVRLQRELDELQKKTAITGAEQERMTKLRIQLREEAAKRRVTENNEIRELLEQGKTDREAQRRADAKIEKRYELWKTEREDFYNEELKWNAAKWKEERDQQEEYEPGSTQYDLLQKKIEDLEAGRKSLQEDRAAIMTYATFAAKLKKELEKAPESAGSPGTDTGVPQREEEKAPPPTRKPPTVEERITRFNTDLKGFTNDMRIHDFESCLFAFDPEMEELAREKNLRLTPEALYEYYSNAYKVILRSGAEDAAEKAVIFEKALFQINQDFPTGHTMSPVAKELREHRRRIRTEAPELTSEGIELLTGE